MTMLREYYTINFIFAKHTTANVRDPSDCLTRNQLSCRHTSSSS